MQRESSVSRHVPMTPQYRVLWWLVRGVVAVFARLEVEGREHLPDGGFILASNHISSWDPAILGLATPGIQMRALGKRELFTPVIGPLIRWLGALSVRRGEIDREAIKACREVLQRGECLILLPEGTRSRTATMIPGKVGLVYLAQVSGVPIVPAAVTGTERTGWPLRRSLFRIRLGPPISIPRSRRDRQQAIDEVMYTIAAMLPAAYRGVYADR